MDQLEPCFRPGSGRRLVHSQSFNVSQNQVIINQNKESICRNVLKSTSLVLEIQNPHLNPINKSERKIVKDVSTNLTRDNCENIFSKNEYESCKRSHTNSVGEKTRHWTQNFPCESTRRTHEINTNNTIPPVRKMSSSTQTYFVNRSSIKKALTSRTQIKVTPSCNRNENFSLNVSESMSGIPGVLNALDDLSRCIDEVIIESPQKICKNNTSDSTQTFKLKEDYHKIETGKTHNILLGGSDKGKILNQLDLLREMVDFGEWSEDSLKADEEVRAYMSTDNDEDTFSSEKSGSWSRLRTLKEHAQTEEAKGTLQILDRSL